MDIQKENIEVVLSEILRITDGVVNIPYYAYGDNEAAVRMAEVLRNIRNYVEGITGGLKNERNESRGY